MLNICHAKITKLGLWFNTKKTTVVCLASGKTRDSTLTLGREHLTTLASYEYLVVWLGADKNLRGEQEEKLQQSALWA